MKGIIDRGGLPLVVAVALLLAGCAARPTLQESWKAPPTPSTTDTVFVSCMAEPPPVAVIDWPTPDSIGNVLMHASTVERVQGAYADLRRYVDEQYFRCLHVAESHTETTVSVEVDP